MTTPIGYLINGDLTSRPHAHLQDVFKPSTNAMLGQVELASRSTVEAAITVAQAALPVWCNLLSAKRAGILARFQELLEAQVDEICAIISAKYGKVIEVCAVNLELTARTPCGFTPTERRSVSVGLQDASQKGRVSRSWPVRAGIPSITYPLVP